MTPIERQQRNEQIVNRYKLGETTNSLADEYLLSYNRVFSILRYSGVNYAKDNNKMPSKKQERNSEIQKEYKAGATIIELSKKYGLSSGLLYDIVKPTITLSDKAITSLDRAKNIVSLYEGGQSFKDIASKYSLSRQRIQRIYSCFTNKN